MEYPTFEEWLSSHYRPLRGSETVEQTEEETSTDEDVTSEEDTSGPADENVVDEEAAGEGDTEGEDDADLDELDRIRRERDEARTRLANAEAAARKAKAEARKAREEAAKKGGNWEQVAREREAELQEANERAQEAETRAVTAEEALDTFKREVRITRLASRLSFKDPEDAIRYLRDQTEATGDDKACERALRKLAEAKPYLVDQRRARGRAMGGENGGPGLTFEDLKSMTPEQVNQAWESGQVQRSLTRGPGG